MDTGDIFATGGTAGLAGLIVIVVYQLLKHFRLKSRCMGQDVELTVGTPQRASSTNLKSLGEKSDTSVKVELTTTTATASQAKSSEEISKPTLDV